MKEVSDVGAYAIWQHGHPWNANGGQARPGERIEKATAHFGARSDRDDKCMLSSTNNLRPLTLASHPSSLVSAFCSPSVTRSGARSGESSATKRRSEQIKPSGEERRGEQRWPCLRCGASPRRSCNRPAGRCTLPALFSATHASPAT